MIKKWYYKLYNEKSKETFYCSLNIPIKAEKIIEFLGLEEFNYIAVEISEDEYIINTD